MENVVFPPQFKKHSCSSCKKDVFVKDLAVLQNETAMCETCFMNHLEKVYKIDKEEHKKVPQSLFQKITSFFRSFLPEFKKK